jgi:nucleoside triphosphate diphosphatase
MSDINKLLEIMKALRDPESGCPWDLQQDFRTIYPYTIEEAYEVADAIDREDWPELQDELGDLLLQIVFHAQMASELGLFEFGDVVESISDKMTRRHPHVFGDQSIGTADEQRQAWADHKESERADAGRTGVLSGIARNLPALMRAEKLGKRAAGVGFDWPDSQGVRAKVDEELAELDEAREQGNPDAVADEMGDLLFAVANLARHLGIDPEDALRSGSDKFERRFQALEKYLDEQGKDWSGLTIEDMEAGWQHIKKNSR